MAMIAGALVPVAVVTALAARDPLPRDCRSGQATPTNIEGALLYSTGEDLWYSEGYPGKPRKLVDYRPARTRPGARPTPGSAGSPPAPASPSPSPSPSASPARLHTPRVVAADISIDRKLVAFLVLDAPGREGSISLQLVSPLDPPGTAPLVPWGAPPDRASLRQPVVRVLDNGKVLSWAPVVPASVPTPSPAPSHPSAPSPSVPAAPSGLAPSPSSGIAVVVVSANPLAILAQASEAYFLAEGHTAWPDTRAYRVPAALPRLEDRVDGPSSRVAGITGRDVGTPLASRHLDEIVIGRAGQVPTTALCSAPAEARLTGFSPDEGQLVLIQGPDSLLLDLTGTHAATRLMAGRVLAWR